ncbi:MAG: LOW QUALITY PROTEIN: uncharacterized protein KVP18_004407 [Porospora cf. gigantea A]|uniref:uncharacterized protein n=1 Tax=Porospora cf. gigantea A TaxID=2853593 RepID=UPI00355A7B1F|nr:MAG: LOW QUALITY PROTEIN: hypothetical protein KVP18_004407 [Porospora cf. gigantea A]
MGYCGAVVREDPYSLSAKCRDHTDAARVAGIFLLASLYLSAQQNIATKTTRCKSEAAEWVFLLSSETQVGRAFVELTPVPSSAVLLATPDPTTLPDFVDTQQLTVAEWVSCVDTERLERAQDVGTEECRLAAGLEGALISRGASKNL